MLLSEGPQVFVDLDGVLADTNGYYQRLYGVRPDQDNYLPVDFLDNVRKHGEFFLRQSVMHDAYELWEGIKKIHPNPIVLSGIRSDIPNMAEHKRIWVSTYFGPEVPLITCKSQHKGRHGRPGDILIDDRLKYSRFWLDMGGVFILHMSARQSLERLRRVYQTPASTGQNARLTGLGAP